MTEKVYTPEVISDNSFPTESGTLNYSISEPGSGDTVSTTKASNNDFPTKRVAVELLSSVLNTKSKKILAEFEFTESGAIQVGKYENGVSGDIRISPVGITARNTSGLTTFSLDGETGDAVFAGTIQTGTLISGTVVVGNSNVIIDGANNRIVIYDDDGTPRILIGYQEGGF